MSDDAKRAQALQEALKTDEAFLADFKKAIESGSTDTVISLAATKDIELFPKDFNMEKFADLDGRELDEEELEAVAGGFDIIEPLACFMYMLIATYN